MLVAGWTCAAPAWAQAPRVPPKDGFTLNDERSIGVFAVQRWVREGTEIFPSGTCECIIIVHQGTRQVLTIGSGEYMAASVDDAGGRDITADGSPELVITLWSGGAHCCYDTTVYSVGDEVLPILSHSGGNCSGRFEDYDGDGSLEFETCDDQWAYAYCAFASSPMPPVVFAYDRSVREYRVATPRFASRYRDTIAANLDEAQKRLSESSGVDLGSDKCTVLGPALDLMYTGRFNDGVALLRGLYRGPDRESFEEETIERVQSSPLWTPR
jgi:hypothetical protein